jgi:CRP/FNR family transcriptional regulator
MPIVTQEVIAKFPFFRDLPDQSLQQLESHMQSSTVDKNTEIIFKGDTVSGVYLVQSGSLRIYTISSRGKETTLYTVQPGESCLLALNCVFSEFRYPAWVSTGLPSTRILTIPSELFRSLHAKEPSVRNFTFDVLSTRLFDLMSTLDEVTSQELDERLASFLIRRANRHLEVKMSHQEIAFHLGTAREVISRLLRQFEQEGLLKIARKCITLDSVTSLASYAHKH